MAIPRRQPPPPTPPTNDPALKNWLLQLNRWFLDLTAIISASGGIDPSVLPGGTTLHGTGVPNDADGADGDLYLNDTGDNTVLNVGLAAESTARKDVSGNQLYGKVSGHWKELV